MSYLAFPYRVAESGRSAVTDVNGYVRGLIEQLLFTAPGERVNRPTFGAGLQQYVFAPASEEMAAATEFSVQASLLQWLGDVIEVAGVDVQAGEDRLIVAVTYSVKTDQRRQVATFERDLETA